MNEIGWLYKSLSGGEAPSADFQKIDFNFKAWNLKLRTATELEISFDGKTTHAKILAADGLVPFDAVNKGEIWYKGSGDAEITAWDGN